MKKFAIGYFSPAFAGSFVSAGFVSGGFPWVFSFAFAPDGLPAAATDGLTLAPGRAF
jgi:hypothetical protein